MNRLALGLSILLFLGTSAIAQSKETIGSDASAVRSTVTNYIEAYYTGDPARMEQTLHPHYLKHMIHGRDIPMREMTAGQMVAGIRKNGPADLPVDQKKEDVTVLDIVGDIASAKLVTPGWTDYMTLSKVNGDWKILSVVQRID